MKKLIIPVLMSLLVSASFTGCKSIEVERRGHQVATDGAGQVIKDKDGNPVEWEIKAVMQDESDMLRKEFTKINKKGERNFDSVGYGRALVARAVVYPNLNSSELQSYYGVLAADRLPSAMLTSGEYATLSNAVLRISNLDDDLSEDVEEAKNA